MQKILFTVLALLFSATAYAQSTEPRDFAVWNGIRTTLLFQDS